ncbi:unnamed protein product, partial [Ectocarpus fasciculatus]
ELLSFWGLDTRLTPGPSETTPIYNSTPQELRRSSGDDSGFVEGPVGSTARGR